VTTLFMVATIMLNKYKYESLYKLNVLAAVHYINFQASHYG